MLTDYKKPVVIFQDEDGNQQFNGGYIPNKKTLLGIKKLIEDRLTYTDKEINCINKEIDEYHRKKEEFLLTSNKVKVKNETGYIYIYKQRHYYKIGKSKKLDCRNKKYITENPDEIHLVFKALSKDYHQAELKLHKIFEKLKYNREWFVLDGQALDFIKSIHISDFGKEYIKEVIINKL